MTRSRKQDDTPKQHRICLIVKWKDDQMDDEQMSELIQLLNTLCRSFRDKTQVDEVYLSVDSKQVINFNRDRLYGTTRA